ncbi:hypothetical protein ABRZ08_13145 [Castellaniella ginsengisoli]|uniref:HeH/LEM domain-containing protein n=1 Tax=Castellaniella ginsengisoli TaxID=546114 RepID=A0AB39G3S5_9BURK
MKVTNPKPCLVNILVDGDYVRIGPDQSADVPEKAVAALIKAGVLVAAGGQHAQAGDDGPKDPADMRATELKAELDRLGVEYAGNASTEVLRSLYEAKLAEQAGQ